MNEKEAIQWLENHGYVKLETVIDGEGHCVGWKLETSRYKYCGNTITEVVNTAAKEGLNQDG